MLEPLLKHFENASWGAISRVGFATCIGVSVFLCVTGRFDFGVPLLAGATVVSALFNAFAQMN